MRVAVRGGPCLALAGILLAAGACGPGAELPPPSGPPGRTRGTFERLPPVQPPPPVSYEPWTIEDAHALARLEAELGPERFDLVLRLNRIDRDHARRGETLMIPRHIAGPLDLAPFSFEVPELEGVPKLIAVSRRVQAFGAYEQGRLARWGPTSTGRRETPTPDGLFFLNWKAKETRSTDNEAWLLKWYFNFHNFRGVSFHEYDLPGRPASHACVRLLAADAEWLYGWGEQWVLDPNGRDILAEGTPVLVFGGYDWEADGGPWTRLAEEPGAATVDPGEFRGPLARYLGAIEAAASRRSALFLSRAGLP